MSIAMKDSNSKLLYTKEDSHPMVTGPWTNFAFSENRPKDLGLSFSCSAN